MTWFTLLIIACVLYRAWDFYSLAQDWKLKLKLEHLGQEAETLMQLEQYEKAEVAAKNALASAEKILSPNHPEIIACLHNLARVYYQQGRYVRPEQLYKRALAIYEKTLGPDHPAVAIFLDNLALLYRATKRDEEAETLDQRAARIRAIQR